MQAPASVTTDKISHGYASFQPWAHVPVVSLGCDGNLENPVTLLPEQAVGLPDLVKLEAMRDERPRVSRVYAEAGHYASTKTAAFIVA